MKKYFSLLILLISFNLEIQSQSVEYIKADSAYNKGYFKEALAAFKNIAESALHENTLGDKDLYIKSSIKAAYCCHNLKIGEEGMNICRPLFALNLNEQYRKQLHEAYSLNGLDRVYDMLMMDELDYARVRAILDSIKPYSEGDLLETVCKRQQYTYVVEGYGYLNNVEYQKAYDCFVKGRYLSSDASMCLMIANGMAKVQEQIGTYESILKEYDALGNLAQSKGSDKYHYRALKAQCHVSRMFNDMERYAMYGAKLDSLISKTTDHNILLEYYQYVGLEFMKVGEFAMAESYYKRYKANAEMEEDEKSRSFLVSTYYSHMRDLKREEGKYAEALKYHTILRKWYEKNYGTDNYLRYTVYFIETQIYADLKDSINFERCCDTLLNVFDIMPSSYMRSLVYNFRGLGYSNFGNSEKALSNFIKADSILATDHSETHDMRLQLLQLRGREYKKMNRLKEALAEYERLAEITKNIYGDKSERYSEALMRLAGVKHLLGDRKESARLYTSSISIMNDILRRQLRYIPSTDRRSYINTFTKRLWIMTSVAEDYRNIDDSFVTLCYNTILCLKSLIFESDRSMYNTLCLEGTDEDVEDFVKMSVLRSKLKSLYKDYDKNKYEIDSKIKTLRELDNKLTLKSQAYKDYTAFLDFKYEDVCAQLNKNDVLFDFFDYTTNEGKRKYVAYVVKKENPVPVIVDLFFKEDVDSIVGSDNIDAVYNLGKSESILKILWNKLEQYAQEGKTVYYVPSGLVYNIALESLPLQDGSLLGEHYDFIRLSSAREIEESRRGLYGEKNAVLYGGLNYDIDAEDMVNESKKFENKELITLRGTVNGTAKFEYLKETLYEIDAVGKILSSNDYNVKFYRDNAGTEESFLSMHNNSPQILHIATHGFYFNPDETAGNKYLNGSTDAMLLSGLVFSGGNAAWLGKELPEGVLGGILTASNISCLNLSNVQLAVLSSCQTGIGKITREGIFGLQRAFKKAGIHTMVLTLWNVSDAVTTEFMIEFYKNLFKGSKKHNSKMKAFVKAKKKIRDKYPEPFYWAGFVMVD